ncbi:DUF3592 domain-containing protein [Oceanobacillus sp. J11TS1]|uniref:DUF3592 domain-containing protein n=1 Tax=Oceanobacillus sp. J11TS1 TaxID=2807191 RepID=UPI001B2A1E1D|nr:DUF3592 domain-containing protein [Oceanobacillus sp. J11TS1]GIO23503.1 hypothetical protein J11TS1_20840 [Oceanobacillus sp. J11TS1]
MIFIGLLFCIIAIIITILKLKIILTGEVVEGKIVGYVRGAKGTYGMVGYNYRILLEYNDEIYYVTSMDGLTTSNGVVPNKNLGRYYKVYFNPGSPDKRVALKGVHKTEWLAFFLFLAGVLIIVIDLASIIQNN